MELLRNADLYDPAPRGRAHLLIAGESIAWIGTEVPAGLGALVEERDLEGRRVIPGLIDCHVHLTGGGGEAGPATRVPPLGLSRDLVIGVGELAISDHRSSQPTLDELLRIAGDAHVGGLMTGKAGILHLHVGNGKRGLEPVRQALKTTEIPARVFNPTHVNRRKDLFQEALELARQGCTIDVTAFPVDKGEDAWSAPEAVTRYLEASLPAEHLTVSSDGGGCFPAFDDEGLPIGMDVGRPAALAGALKALLDCGQPLDRILPAFTSNAARLLLLHKKGRLRTGMDADLVVLDSDGSIEDVMARGRWHVLSGSQVVRGTFEERE
jgi:beta-aspartyl-dipeptidase (metallo-type)